MKIIVCAKQAIDLPGPAVLLDDLTGIDPLFTRAGLNDPDRYALEEALCLAENHEAGEVVMLTVGNEDSDKTLRKCLAMGAHRAVRIPAAGVALHDPLMVGRALAQAIRREAADLILCGVQSEDLAQQATGPALASVLGAPCVTMATKLEWPSPDGPFTVHREARAGVTEVVEVDLPCVLAVQTGINTPRSETFKAVMQAKKATIEVFEPTGLAPSHLTLDEVRANVASRSQLTLVEGGPEAVAARILGLIREAQ